uniref:Uncharacterized protein n=1 Tax=Anguilla anguilla TaxID=7936 RepID=A0A0E9WTU7_ANGAN
MLIGLLLLPLPTTYIPRKDHTTFIFFIPAFFFLSFAFIGC